MRPSRNWDVLGVMGVVSAAALMIAVSTAIAESTFNCAGSVGVRTKRFDPAGQPLSNVPQLLCNTVLCPVPSEVCGEKFRTVLLGFAGGMPIFSPASYCGCPHEIDVGDSDGDGDVTELIDAVPPMCCALVQLHNGLGFMAYGLCGGPQCAAPPTCALSVGGPVISIDPITHIRTETYAYSGDCDESGSPVEPE